MNYNQLLYIVEISKTSTLSQAADNLNISQSGLTQALNQIEKNLGIKLFYRSKQGTEMTQEGYKVIEQAKNILKEYNTLHDILSEKNSEAVNQVSFGITNAIPYSFLQVLLDYQKKFPEFKVKLTELQSKDIIIGVNEGIFDVGLVTIDIDFYSQIQNLAFHKIIDGELNLYVGKSNYLANSDNPISIELFQEQEFVLFDDEYIDNFIKRFERKYGPLNISVRTTSYDVLSTMIREFNAVSVIRDYQINDDMAKYSQDNFVSKSIKHIENKKYSYGWVTHEDTHLNALTNSFIEDVTRTIKLKYK